MSATNLPSFPAFQPHIEPSTAGVRWRKYVNRLENLFVAFKVTDNKQQRALLLHYAGPEVMDIFETLSETGSTYESGKDALTTYFEPHKNIEYERFVFREAKQLHNETVTDYATHLQQLAKTCEFHDKDSEVKSQIIHGCKSSKLRRYALRESELTLVKLLMTARTYELSEVQAKGMEQHTQPSSDMTNRVTTTKSHTRNRESSKAPHAAKPRRSVPCRNCGGTFPHKQQCPAKGVTYHLCGKLNHFAKHSLRRGVSHKPLHNKAKVHAVDHTVSSSSSDDDYVFGVSSTPNSKHPLVTITVDQTTQLPAIIDTGASVNVMCLAVYDKLSSHPPLCKDAAAKVFAYGSTTPLEIVGTFNTTIAYKTSHVNSTFFVTKPTGDTLLSFQTASALDIIHAAYNLQISLWTSTLTVSQASAS